MRLWDIRQKKHSGTYVNFLPAEVNLGFPVRLLFVLKELLVKQGLLKPEKIDKADESLLGKPVGLA